jgi:hypothetical protein
VARPTSATWLVSQGNAALSNGASTSLASTSRERGPATTKTPRLMVILRKVTLPSWGSICCR